MEALFDAKNWSDLLSDSSFWDGALVLTLAAAALLSALFADNITEWRAQREERVKWLHWNR